MTHGVRCTHVDPDDRAAWLEHRTHGVGASDIAAILGISKWATPYTLWREKTTGLYDPTTTDDQEWGLLVEDALAGRWAKHYGATIERGTLYHHPEHPWRIATPDYLVLPDGDPLETKTGAGYTTCPPGCCGWGPSGTDEIPCYYRTQVLWQMHVLGAPRAHVTGRLDNRGFVDYVVDHDPVDVEAIVAAADAFWHKVVERIEPPIDGLPPTTRALTRAYRRINPDEVVPVSAALADEYEAAREALGEAKAAYETVQNRLRAAMQNAWLACDPDGRPIAKRQEFDPVDVPAHTRAGYVKLVPIKRRETQ